MQESILYTEVQSLSWFQLSSFAYLSKMGFTLLKSIAGLPEKIETTKNSRKMKSENPEKYQFDEEWTAKLNKRETWEAFHQAGPYWTDQIKQLQYFWDKQKEFSSCSNDFLIKSLDAVKFSLRHIKKARKEYAKSGWRLPKSFARRYDEYLHNMHDALVQKRAKIVGSMLGRLRIASVYSNVASERKQHVDDVLFYVTDSLTVLNIVDRMALYTIPPRTSLNGNHYVKFYNAVKQYGENDAEKYRVDQFHWTMNLGSKASLLSLPTLGKPKDKTVQNVQHPQAGVMLVETGKNNNTKIAAPYLLKGFITFKRLSPGWYFWQDRKILSFWERRQSFLFKLHDLFHENIDVTDKLSLLKLEKYQYLIQAELQNMKKEKIPFFAFKLKDMIAAWKDILNRLSICSVNQLKEAMSETHQKQFIADLKRSQPIPIPASKRRCVINPVADNQQSENQNISEQQNKQSDSKNIPPKKELIEPSQDEIFNDNTHGFFGHW